MQFLLLFLFASDNGGGMFSPARPRSFVRLSVGLCARLLKNACMDLDEMLRVERCRDMNELIILRFTNALIIVIIIIIIIDTR